MARVVSLLLGAIASQICDSRAESFLDPTLQIMQNRIRQQTIIPPNMIRLFDANLDYVLSVLKPDGSFSDLDYDYQQPAIWPAYNHTMRAQYMAAAWISPSSKFYNNATFVNTALHVLDWWLVNGTNIKQSNWWWWTIGVPISLGPTVNVLSDLMAPNQTAAAVVQLLHANPSGYTACNLIWTCEGTIYRGVLTGNVTAVQTGLNLSYATIAYAGGNEEGIKEDASFFQHGAQLYSGGYGMSYVQGIAMFLSWTSGTPLGIADSDPRIDVFSHLMLDGSLRMVRYGTPPADTIYAPGMFDISTVGRDIARPYGSNWANQAGVQVEFSAELIATVGGPRASEFVAFGALLNGSATESQLNVSVGSRVYYQADYVLHSSAVGTFMSPVTGGALGWMGTVRMASTRTLRCECINGENLHGLHLSDGPVWLYLDGYEYVDTQPVWDWMRLPGTTVLPYAVPWTCGGLGTSAFVGGVQDVDGGLASAVQDYVAANKEGLTLRKSVFFFPDLYVALGANLSAASPNRTSFAAWTTIAQRRLSATGQNLGVYTSAGGSSLPAQTNTSLPSTTWWLWEGGIGYLFPEAYKHSNLQTQVWVTNNEVSGLWQDIGAESGNVTTSMFTLWMVHPAPVANASYAYIVVPNIGFADFKAEAEQLVQQVVIVRNDGGAQAVLHNISQALQATVFSLDEKSPSATLPGGPGWSVSVTSVGAYSVRAAIQGGQGGLAFTAAQPAQPGATWDVSVTIDRAVQPGFAPCTATGVQLPTAAGNGSSTSAWCAL